VHNPFVIQYSGYRDGSSFYDDNYEEYVKAEWLICRQDAFEGEYSLRITFLSFLVLCVLPPPVMIYDPTIIMSIR